jgi:hypothetical protein
MPSPAAQGGLPAMPGQRPVDPASIAFDQNAILDKLKSGADKDILFLKESTPGIDLQRAS